MHINDLIEFIKTGPLLKWSVGQVSFSVKNDWEPFRVRPESWGPPSTALDDLGDKAAARILLADRISGLVVPTAEQWHGLNKLERDDEL